MMESESRRFPQRRNGVTHNYYGDGVVVLGPHLCPDGMVLVEFTSGSTAYVYITDLQSNPKMSRSPDPKTSRNSGWVTGNSYRKK